MRSSFPSDTSLPKVEIHVTEVCNNRCAFCTTGWINAEQGPRLAHIPREVIRQQLEQAHASGARRALFQGGEPTMRRDLGELLADARAIGFEATTIFTNARMAASPAGARWLLGMGVTWFQVSIQGGTAEAHDASVVAKGAFAQTIAGARRLIEAGARVKINAVLTRHLVDSLAAFADLMIDLRPEEIGFDTVKPSSAFDAGRATYAELVPKFSSYARQLANAVRAIDDAGLTVRMTSFPACLVPEAAAWVSEEAPETLTQLSDGRRVRKIAWKRDMQRKSPGCASCAYDEVCGGVYESYASIHGVDELSPLAQRAPPPHHQRTQLDSELTRAFRRLFVAGSGDEMGVRAVRALADGAHELLCFSPRGEVRVWVGNKDIPAAYAETDRFAVTYQTPASGSADLRVVDAIVRALRRVEPRLPNA